MYSLDINFLNDRPDIKPQTQGTTARARPTGSMTPLILGVVVGLLLPGLVGVLWLFLQQQNQGLEQQEAQLQSELQRQNAEKQKISQLQDQINKVNSETTALAGVFNRIKPWSAILQDIRERTPPNLQIRTIEQKQVAPTANASPPPAAAPKGKAQGKPPSAAPPAPTTNSQLEISGTARSFDDVNGFLLALQRSSFLKSDATQLINAELVSNPDKLDMNIPGNRGQSGARVTYQLPKSVQYKIQTSLNDVPASDLLRELDRKGAVGLVSRIRTLQGIQEKGESQP